MAYARLALREAFRDHLYDPNVSMVDIGLPEHDGEVAVDELAVRVHVRRKLPRAQLEAAGTRPVPAAIGPIPTDVVEARYRPHVSWPVSWPPVAPNLRAGRVDPLRGGISISDEAHNAYATLGCKVLDRVSGDEMILSNWHVLVADWTARPGQRIFQPGRLDGGTAADTVARLTRDAMSTNLDAAVATLTGARRLINDQVGVGPITGVRPPALALDVTKSGRRTGVTQGRVTGIEGKVSITYGWAQRIIGNVTSIGSVWGREVSAPGDSGSIWLDFATREGIGLHFAGSDQPERALAMDLRAVLNALAVDLDTRSEAAQPVFPGLGSPSMRLPAVPVGAGR